ncbi:MAG: class I mannose-6-phosphate isomerase [Ruminococcaceae bacterium]|nr:class I mannose-6-phosphate isomerase [Oscillospiraceae bacterium]
MNRTRIRKYPLKLRAVPKEILWGGDRLKRNYNKKADFQKLAESWELTVRPDGMSIIENGIYAGRPLSELVENGGADFLGRKSGSFDRFPLLIKFIDAKEKLSVQVHPDDEYALLHENEWGKTEMWYIMEADEGAELVYGLKEGVSVEEFARLTENGKAEDALFYTDVKKGDVFFIPSGQVHAIGGGILLAEIQQNSNVTYRVFDYNRKQGDGTLRELHTEKALDVVKLRNEGEIDALRFACGKNDTALLCACPFFTVYKYDISAPLPLHVSEDSFLSVLVLHGEGAITQGDEIYTFVKGDSWLLPSGLGDVVITGEAELLITSL